MKLKDSLIIILAVVIAIVIGVVIGIKLTESKNNNSVTDNEVTDDNQEQNKDDSDNSESLNFTLNDAKKLMDNYLIFDNYYIDELSDINKNGLSIKKASATEYNNDYFYYLFGHDLFCGSGESMYSYSYDEVLNIKKKMFGNDEVLKKDNFNYLDYSYLYSEKTNSYIDMGACGGGYSPEYEASIVDYKIINDILYVYVSQKTIDLYGNGESLGKREYIFKKQDSGYYMFAVEEIN